MDDTEHQQSRRQRLGACLRKSLKWIGLALLWILWHIWSVVFCICGAALLFINHPVWGTLCIVIGIISGLIGVYCDSPRFKSGDAKRGFADFKVWLRERLFAIWEATKKLFKWMAGLAVAGVCVVLVVGGYLSIDNSGWIIHRHDTPVWIQGDWLVGEYRTCGLLTAPPVARRVLSQDPHAELPRLFCGMNSSLSGFDILTDFQNAMPDTTSASNALTGGDWSAFGSYFHVLPVRYYGRIDRPEMGYVFWRCQRLSGILQSASLECKAVN